MNIARAIVGTDWPSPSRRSTSASLGLSASRCCVVRRLATAFASPEAVNDEAATAACLIDARISSTPCGLGDERGDAGLQRSKEHVVLVLRGQHHDAQVGVAVAQLARQPQAGAVG